MLGLRDPFHELGMKIAEPMKLGGDQATGNRRDYGKCRESKYSFLIHLPLRSRQVCTANLVKSGEMIEALLTKALLASRMAELHYMFSMMIMHGTGKEECCNM